MRRQAIRWALVLIWLAVTMHLSQQNATASAATSGWLAHKILVLLSFVGINVSYPVFHAVIRKVAHFGVHFILAWLGYRALLASCKRRANAIVITLLFFGAIAIIDEYMQSFAPGRAMMLFDAMINLSGILTGTIVGVVKTKQYA